MRKIYIDENLENIAINYSKTLFVNRRVNFDKPKDKLNDLATFFLNSYPNDLKYSVYIKKIIDEYDAINALKPSLVQNKKDEFDNILPEAELNFKIKEIEDNEFYKIVVDLMRYDAIRDKDFLPYLKKVGIKSCVYCNAQLTVVTEKNVVNDNFSAKLELDHHYPKSKYPFLCTSFFNLYPTCGNCNRAKWSNEADFVLYTENYNDLDVFKFIIDDSSFLKYRDSGNIDDLIINFISLNDEIDPIQHNNMFCINGIYDTQKDIVEELILKKDAYSVTYKIDLVNLYKDLFPDVSLINRLLIGNYNKPEDIHKRPLSKFTQDIAEYLELI